MDDGVNLLNIILLAIAVGVFLKLRSVLGRRTGHERPPYDPYSGDASGNDKVVTLPKRPRAEAEAGVRTVDAQGDPFADTPRRSRWHGIAEPGTPLADGLNAIAAADAHFDADAFLSGARTAYEMIVTAFAEGDRETLKPLLSADVYKSFESAMDERDAKGLKVEQAFIGIEKAVLDAAALEGTRARLTVSFRSTLTSCTKNDDGVVVEGDPVTVREVTDLWTFERDVKSRDPNWKLVATGASG
ncbi:Tim44/TimA family putative adaptor protein [Parvibaculum sp.]|jgi:predicted lipid-binding transport protein (Tim44 family)|uniref:Tim44/TimA family putative adaptor protein n=1 Tax=Parvibaculum sp. TaxID=2024848 RepID=UPI000C5F5E24|nr:Tim44/TimA family putative adaptor protein [Parvibaculum sp.]MAM95885.1 calcium-binding protein [Parvibaculum sp.]HCX66863.1 calcium-binding protein [Rhodobiaceae bacterium]|tara:strand:- start:40744 stop:41475 length:732 start_codon:yes stop_codon:yes gene_type:complete